MRRQVRLDGMVSRPDFGAKKIVRSANADSGTHDWQYVQLKIEAADLEAAPWFATVTVASAGKGTVWFDDVSCVETPANGLVNRPPRIDGNGEDQSASAELVNRLPNGDFESLDESGWAIGWKKPTLWTWFRNDYYAFTGWSHFDAKLFRGSATVDRMLSFGGGNSMRMTVFPGDNFAVESEPIHFDQTTACPIEVRAMVTADNLRTLEIMARDERRELAPAGRFPGRRHAGAWRV